MRRSPPPDDDGGFPREGVPCERCGTRVPVLELAAADEQRVRERIAADAVGAMQELRLLTGCSERWAKIWVAHALPRAELAAAPCPYCGARLRTAAAQQCLACGMDWHDPANPRRLGS